MSDHKQTIIQNPNAMYYINIGKNNDTDFFADYQVAKHCLDEIRKFHAEAKLMGCVTLDNNDYFKAKFAEARKRDLIYMRDVMGIEGSYIRTVDECYI